MLYMLSSSMPTPPGSAWNVRCTCRRRRRGCETLRRENRGAPRLCPPGDGWAGPGLVAGDAGGVGSGAGGVGIGAYLVLHAGARGGQCPCPHLEHPAKGGVGLGIALELQAQAPKRVEQLGQLSLVDDERRRADRIHLPGGGMAGEKRGWWGGRSGVVVLGLTVGRRGRGYGPGAAGF